MDINWEAVGAIAESLGAVGVILTLVYLAVQIRQNTSALEDTKRLSMAQAYERRAQMVHDNLINLRDSERAIEAITKFQREGAENLTEVEGHRVLLDRLAEWERIDNVFKQRELGFLDERFFDGFDAQVLGSVKAARALGADDLSFLRPALRTEVERILTEAGYPVDFSADSTSKERST